MSEKKLQMKVFMELNMLLTRDVVQKLMNALNVPDEIRQKQIEPDAILFLNDLQNWDRFNPNIFDRTLQEVGDQTLLETARKLEWLSSPFSLKELLTTELSPKEWKFLIMCGASKVNVKGDENAEEMFQLCIEHSVISKDMEDLCDSLEILKRTELAQKVRIFTSTFEDMSAEDFLQEMHGQKRYQIQKAEVSLASAINN